MRLRCLENGDLRDNVNCSIAAHEDLQRYLDIRETRYGALPAYKDPPGPLFVTRYNGAAYPI